jgi:predicted nucleic acid-binding Zn ribbon protein
MLQLKQTNIRQDISMEEISRILPLIFRSQVRRDNPRVVEILAPLWPQVAGKPMARHSRPVAFEEGTLTLESDCTAWSAEMRRIADDIRAQINRYLGVPTVRKLKVRYVSQTMSAATPLPDRLKVN